MLNECKTFIKNELSGWSLWKGLWLAIATITVVMWFIVFTQGGNLSTVLMWAVYLINVIIMFLKWYKESKQNEVKVVE